MSETEEPQVLTRESLESMKVGEEPIDAPSTPAPTPQNTDSAPEVDPEPAEEEEKKPARRTRATKKDDEGEERTVKKQGIGMTLDGNLLKPEDIPGFVPARLFPQFGYEHEKPSEVDYEDFQSLNRAILNLRSKLYWINEQITETRRRETAVRSAYNQEYARTLLRMTGSTEAMRKAYADLACAELRNELEVTEAVLKEQTNIYYLLTRDFEMLKTVGDNMRRAAEIH